jgi:hypothetical protein
MKADMALFNWRGCGEIEEGHNSFAKLSANVKS